MNKAEFHIVAEHPENLSKAHLAELKNILADFPWFQAGQAMLLRTLHNLNHYDFDKQLHHTAILVPDREVLFQYIYDVTKPADVATTDTVEKHQDATEPVVTLTHDSASFADQVEKHISDSVDSDTANNESVATFENTVNTETVEPVSNTSVTEHTEITEDRKSVV